MSIVAENQVPALVQVVDGVFRGKWGYYPCSRETFLEIKELHRYALHNLRCGRRWKRWNEKLSHNRKGGEPEAMGGVPDDYYELVLAEYRNARRPVYCQESVQRMSLPSKWQSTLAKLRGFYGELKK